MELPSYFVEVWIKKSFSQPYWILKDLYFEYNPVPVHESQYNKENHTIACSEQYRIPLLQILLGSVEQRCSNATEVYELTYEICRYGIASKIEQPIPAFGMSFDIYPPIGQRKEQITPAGAVESETCAPYALDDGLRDTASNS